MSADTAVKERAVVFILYATVLSFLFFLHPEFLFHPQCVAVVVSGL